MCTPCLAREPQSTFIVKSKFFSVFGPLDFDVLDALSKIDYSYFLQADTLLDKDHSEPKTVLGKTLDAIFLESSKVLGINAYSFNATIVFLADQNTVKVIIKNMTGVDVQERAFYLHDAKTIYVSLEDLSIGVLGHEIAHAIISYYFGAPPAENIQEILAGYVDYSLSKSVKNNNNREDRR